MTKKEVFKHKLKLLKDLSCETPKRVHISKSGNYYVYLSKTTIEKVVKYTPMNVCKSSIGKMFTERSDCMGEMMLSVTEYTSKVGHKFYFQEEVVRYFKLVSLTKNEWYRPQQFIILELINEC
jgi:hypothetical protein